MDPMQGVDDLEALGSSWGNCWLMNSSRGAGNGDDISSGLASTWRQRLSWHGNETSGPGSSA